MSDKKSSRGRPKLYTETMRLTFRLRKGRSEAEDALVERLGLLKKGQRSRFLRRVLTTGDIEPVLEREFAKETECVANAVDALATFWD